MQAYLQLEELYTSFYLLNVVKRDIRENVKKLEEKLRHRHRELSWNHTKLKDA